MPVNKQAFLQISADLDSRQVRLVAVSKTKPIEEIRELYDLGQRDFGENYVQELVDKQRELPADIHWHFIGHLQSNKVKMIAPFIHLIQSVDSLKLLQEINKQAAKNNRAISVLLQVHIAQEDTKYGLDESELEIALTYINENPEELRNVGIKGLMGMASLSDDVEKVKSEFRKLKSLFDKFRSNHSDFKILSMGMSGDYDYAIEEGSNLVRIGSLLFGERNYS
jgi:PLP dependent protein